ncbi:hypothetical protein M6B38_113725 [Iris pallida]|uniref:Uncharacterized protein n=1 Tax=Iris pallida TaxID=29817 RepID=A0AAX6IP44_IRIPA|nr:hypothetical protein M6B38_113725 [Iris pallida]
MIIQETNKTYKLTIRASLGYRYILFEPYKLLVSLLFHPNLTCAFTWASIYERLSKRASSNLQ